jgi:hypothetical protein
MINNFKGLDWEFIQSTNLNNLNMEYRLKAKKNSKAEKRSSSSDDSYEKKRKRVREISSKNSIHRSSSERKSRENRSNYFIQSDKSDRKKLSDELHKGPRLNVKNYHH